MARRCRASGQPGQDKRRMTLLSGSSVEPEKPSGLEESPFVEPPVWILISICGGKCISNGWNMLKYGYEI